MPTRKRRGARKNDRGSNRSTTEIARSLVRDELISRGAKTVEEEQQGRSVRFRVWSAQTHHQFRIRVRARTSGDWHASLAERDPPRAVDGLETFWVFTDLSKPESPGFFIVPEWWMRRDIHHITKAI
jgi:hypothetical protein